MDGSAETPTTTSSKTTSIGLPVIVESLLSSLCLVSSLYIYFFEQANVYCRAVALQNIMLFYLFFALFVFILTSILAFGMVWEYIMFVYVGIALIAKVVQMVIAALFSKSERFIGIPPISTFILNKASAL
ncbi:hypothetical protein EIN_275070 [Entamoeba invadens IP1]|uniref:Uncharacterized protein n=1 Tax=Entamoeba invadens IP1 TaxID=370355 RepID=A0A0A1U1M0_ENTIV|nr:hypothetical protein EIN_275070 [Entamoeba invadens IP1]ELP87920.1 hypothetical protein EIN_275070 [Entamoeba invadens IP1]|eukprot:XP_004254691.1 hypothetical protein EIN_275070 [Entamoeba invadens IP1]